MEQQTLNLLDGLNDEQLEAVTFAEGPLLIIAGPGSGKTRVLTSRIAYLISEYGVAPWNILALTFTNKAAREMKSRVEAIIGDRARWITMGTFHSFSARILRQYGDEIGIDPRFTIYDDGDQLGVIKTILKQLNLDAKQYAPRSILSAISRAKSLNIDPVTFEQGVGSYWEEIVSRVYPLYQDNLQLRNALDFDDLLSSGYLLLSEAEHARTELQERYQYVLVDEYQDTNHLQYLIVNKLAESHRNLCVVGDPDQSIYGWRAADIRNILNFKSDYPETEEIHLEENYRSSPEILTAADSVIQENIQRIDRKLRTSRDPGEKIILRECSDEFAEASFVVGEVLRLLSDGTSGADIAVLYRTNAQSRTIEEALIQAGIPYQLIGGTRFYERKEIKDILSLLRLLANPDDTSAFERVLANMPLGDGVGAKTIAGLDTWSLVNQSGLSSALDALGTAGGPDVASRGLKLLVDVRDVLAPLRESSQSQTLTELFDEALEVTGYQRLFESGDPEMAERWENVLQLRSVIEEWELLGTAEENDEELLLTRFLEETALVSDADTIENQPDRITLITLHAVKGLEFPVVFIIGAEEGLIPHFRSIGEDPSAIEEERRLFYVGITRAEKRLYISHARQRSRFGFRDLTVPSPFLVSIPDDVIGDLPTLQPGKRKNSFTSRRQLQNQNQTQHAEDLTSKLDPGDRVFHNSFGDGVVMEVIESSGDYELVIEFKRHGNKRLLASMANLTVG